MKFLFFQQILEEYTNVRFRENLFSRSRVAPFVRMDGETDMPKLYVAFRDFS